MISCNQQSRHREMKWTASIRQHCWYSTTRLKNHLWCFSFLRNEIPQSHTYIDILTDDNCMLAVPKKHAEFGSLYSSLSWKLIWKRQLRSLQFSVVNPLRCLVLNKSVCLFSSILHTCPIWVFISLWQRNVNKRQGTRIVCNARN